MTREIDVPDAVFAELASTSANAKLSSSPCSIGAYNMLTRFFKALKVDPEP